MSPCVQKCFLRRIQRRTYKLLEKYQDIKEDLEDLLQNEPAWREMTTQKINIIKKKLDKFTRKSQKIKYCLENECDACYPENGTPYE